MFVQTLLEQNSVHLHLVDDHIALLGTNNDLSFRFVLGYAPNRAAYGRHEFFGRETCQIVEDNEPVQAGREQLRSTPNDALDTTIRRRIDCLHQNERKNYKKKLKI